MAGTGPGRDKGRLEDRAEPPPHLQRRRSRRAVGAWRCAAAVREVRRRPGDLGSLAPVRAFQADGRQGRQAHHLHRRGRWRCTLVRRRVQPAAGGGHWPNRAAPLRILGRRRPHGGARQGRGRRDARPFRAGAGAERTQGRPHRPGPRRAIAEAVWQPAGQLIVAAGRRRADDRDAGTQGSACEGACPAVGRCRRRWKRNWGASL
jgi:hypothetical protein